MELERVMELAMSKGLALPAIQNADAHLVGRIEAALDQYDKEARQGRGEPTSIRRLLRFTAAAAIFVLLAGAGWWLAVRHTPGAAPGIGLASAKPDITPGHNAAILALSSGRQVLLGQRCCGHHPHRRRGHRCQLKRAPRL